MHYHPERPSRSVLYPGLVTTTTMGIVGMLGLSAFATLGWLGFGLSRLIARFR